MHSISEVWQTKTDYAKKVHLDVKQQLWHGMITFDRTPLSAESTHISYQQTVKIRFINFRSIMIDLYLLTAVRIFYKQCSYNGKEFKICGLRITVEQI